MVKFEDLKKEASSWAKEYCKALNDNKTYEMTAKGWGVGFEGALHIIFGACGEVEEDIGAFVDLKAGKCLGITVLKPGQEPPRKAILKVSGTLFNWKKVVFKEVEIIPSLMSGLLKLDGEMSLAMRYARAAVELINSMEKTDRTLFKKYDLGNGTE